MADRVHGGWLGRAVGCLLGKPVEKIPREGIRAIAESTGNWPLRTYFTAAGLDPGVAAAYPWNRASRTTSLVENIAGMPEDDDLNYALLALTLAERHGDALTTDDVALAWLELLPAKRVFTAERIAYRNLLDGYEPDEAGAVGNPFQDWIGAQIRTDVYGWICPGDPAAPPAGMAGRSPQPPPQRPVRGDVRRRGLVGGGRRVDGRRVRRCRSVGGPAGSRYARAIRRGVELGRSSLDTEAAIDALYGEFGHLHWVHVLNNAALLAFALTRSRGDFATAITTIVPGGWDTDSRGPPPARSAVPSPARRSCLGVDRAARQPAGDDVPGFDGIGFDELAARTVAARLPRSTMVSTDFDPLVPRPIDRPTTCRSTATSTRASPTGRRSSPPPTTLPIGRRGVTSSSGGATKPTGGSPSSTTRRPAGRHDASPRRSCGCGTSGCSTTSGASSPRAGCSPTPTRFGGFDAVVLWHAYPIIGLDDRNQVDFYRDVAGLGELVAELQRQGVRVLLDYNPWDVGRGASR